MNSMAALSFKSATLRHHLPILSLFMAARDSNREIQRRHAVSNIVTGWYSNMLGWICFSVKREYQRLWKVNSPSPSLPLLKWQITSCLVQNRRDEGVGGGRRGVCGGYVGGEGKEADFKVFLRNRHFIQPVLFLMSGFKRRLFFFFFLVSFHLFLPSAAKTPPP